MTTTTSGNVHASVIRLQVRNMSDEQLVEFYEQNREFLDETPELSDIVALMAEAYDRINAAKQAEVVEAQVARQVAEQPRAPMTDAEKRAEKRAKLAETLRDNGCNEAADAVESDPEGMDGFRAAMAVKVIKAAVLDGKAQHGRQNWTKVAWAIIYQFKTVAERASEDKVLFFLAPLFRALSSLSNDKVSNDILLGAERTLESAKPVSEWGQWALTSLSRLIRSGEITPWEPNQPAEDFLARLHAEIRSGINCHREANRAWKSAQEQRRQANRAARNGQGKSGKKEKK